MIIYKLLLILDRKIMSNNIKKDFLLHKEIIINIYKNENK